MWQKVASSLFDGQGSYGNGAAMRVAPFVGAYFADDLDLVVTQARKSAEITHTHPEAIIGAIIIDRQRCSCIQFCGKGLGTVLTLVWTIHAWKKSVNI